MAVRTVALLLDDLARRDVDLVRALYDREGVDRAPPYIPLVPRFEENTPSTQLLEWMRVLVSVYSPFMLALGRPEARPVEGGAVLEAVGTDGAETAQALAAALYRDVFPHHLPDDPTGTPLVRTTLALGAFGNIADADQAAAALRDKTYFLVISQAALLEARDDEGHDRWDVVGTLDLGVAVLSDG